MVKPEGGGFTLHYDPAIGDAFRHVTAESVAQGEAALWALYDHIGADTLLLRGAQSDLLFHRHRVGDDPARTQGSSGGIHRRGPCPHACG